MKLVGRNVQSRLWQDDEPMDVDEEDVEAHEPMDVDEEDVEMAA